MESQQFMLDRLVKLVPGQLMELPDLKGEVGIIDEHVDVRELLACRSHHRVDLIRFCHIRLKDHASAARLFDALKNFLRGLPILIVVYDNRGPRAR